MPSDSFNARRFPAGILCGKRYRSGGSSVFVRKRQLVKRVLCIVKNGLQVGKRLLKPGKPGVKIVAQRGDLLANALISAL